MDGIEAFGFALGNLPNYYKQQREQGKAADLLYKSTPEFQQAVGIPEEKWSTLGSKEKISAMQQVSQVMAAKKIFADMDKLKLGNDASKAELDAFKQNQDYTQGQRSARPQFFDSIVARQQPAPTADPEQAFKPRQPDWNMIFRSQANTGYQPTPTEAGMLENLVGKPVGALDTIKAQTELMGAQTARDRLALDKKKLENDSKWSLEPGQYVKGQDGRFGLAQTPNSVQWFEEKKKEIEAVPVKHEGRLVGVTIGGDFKSLAELKTEMPQFKPATDTNGKLIDGLYVNTQTMQPVKMTPDILAQFLNPTGKAAAPAAAPAAAKRPSFRYEPGKGLVPANN